jgi:hypothetical protein
VVNLGTFDSELIDRCMEFHFNPPISALSFKILNIELRADRQLGHY